MNPTIHLLFSFLQIAISSCCLSPPFCFHLPFDLFSPPSPVGWGVEQGVGGFGDDPGVKAQILNLIRSVRTVMRGWKASFLMSPGTKYNNIRILQFVYILLFSCFHSAFNNSELGLHRPVVTVRLTAVHREPK